MLSCLGARIGTFPKGSRLLRLGDMVEEVGLVLNVSVERSGLSLELGKMRREWLLDFHKSHFLLKVRMHRAATEHWAFAGGRDSYGL